jgi:hypothetical protein
MRRRRFQPSNLISWNQSGPFGAGRSGREAEVKGIEHAPKIVGAWWITNESGPGAVTNRNALGVPHLLTTKQSGKYCPAKMQKFKIN